MKPAPYVQAKPPRSKVFFVLGIFFVFYVIQPLLMTQMKEAGIPHKRIDFSWSTFVFMLPNYYAMVPVGFLPSRSSLADMTLKEWKTGCALSALDLVNQLMSKVGLMMTGASAYILINSSGIIWTVGLTMLFLRKRPTLQQLFGIFLVFVGLCMKVFDSASHKNSDASPHELLGIGIVVLSSILDGATFVLIEKFQKGPDAIPGPQLSCMQGTFASVALTLWTLFYTLSSSGWQNFIVDGVSKSCEDEENVMQCLNDHGRVVIYCLYFLFMANCCTSGTVWWLLLNVGAVTFVVVKALKIVLVFLIAHFMYCSKDDTTECISAIRCGCAGFCVLGVVIYSLAPKPSQSQNSEEQEREENMIVTDENMIVTDAVGLSFTSSSSVQAHRDLGTDSEVAPNRSLEMQLSG